LTVKDSLSYDTKRYMAPKPHLQVKLFPPSTHRQPIIILQSPHSRALNVGYLTKRNGTARFVPCRLNFGTRREDDTYQATVQSLNLPQVAKILKKYKPDEISTVTVLRETLACRLGSALAAVGIKSHYGDAFIGATHIKGEGKIRTAYLYENTEGLTPHGLWIIGESFCIGRNLAATMRSLLSKFKPKEILFIAPIASRRAINRVGSIIAKKHIPTTYVSWGALFGVNEQTLYDMPWGHPDTEELDPRDRKVFISMYGPRLCVGGDFGNNYYSPQLARQLYEEQLKEHHIKPRFPSVKEILKLYRRGELICR
jgi:hypothetical protein